MSRVHRRDSNRVVASDVRFANRRTRLETHPVHAHSTSRALRAELL